MKGETEKDERQSYPKSTTINDIGSEEVSAISYNKSLFKKLFYISLLAMLGIFWVSGYDVSFHSDEMDMNIYAKRNIAYYMSGGMDTSYLSIDHPNDGAPALTILRYYTSGFDYIAVAINNIIGNADGYEYNVRHALNQLLAVIAILFTGLIVALLANYRAGLISIWLLFLTPIFFGLALFNTKDIPFCSGYIASIYFILRFLRELPQIDKKIILGLILSISFACSIRVGGLLLLAYLFSFTGIYFFLHRTVLDKKAIAKIVIAITLTAAIALLILIGGWPYILEDPIVRLRQAMNIAESFPQRIPINFDGKFTISTEVPKTYLFTYFTYTVPVLILIAYCCSLIVIYLKRKSIYAIGLLLVLFATFFPVLYALTKDLALYNSWRHFLFIYPTFIVIAGIGSELLIQELKKPALRYAILGILTLGMLHPILWTVRAHPYGYMYYNEVAGGFKNNYYDFESDYWQISTKEGLDWLVEQELLLELEDTVTIATNSFVVLEYHLKKRYPTAKVKLVYSGYAGRAHRAWTYGIFNNILNSGTWLKDHFPPKKNLLHVVAVDDMPLTVVLKDVFRIDNIAQEYYYHNKFKEADSVFNILRQQNDGKLDERTKPLLGIMAFCKASLEQNDTALYYAEQALAYNSYNYEANLVLGVLSFYNNDFANAQKFLEVAVKIKPDDTQATGLLKHISTLQQ